MRMASNESSRTLQQTIVARAFECRCGALALIAGRDYVLCFDCMELYRWGEQGWQLVTEKLDQTVCPVIVRATACPTRKGSPRSGRARCAMLEAAG
jgi:hypothetical protein